MQEFQQILDPENNSFNYLKNFFFTNDLFKMKVESDHHFSGRRFK